MPIARFQMPDGRIGRFEVPAGLTPEQATSLIQQEVLGSQPEAKPTDRTFGEAATDIYAGLKSGVGSLLQLPSQVAGVVTGDYERPGQETGLAAAGKEMQREAQELKSPGLKAREEARAAKVAEAEKKGQLDAFFTAFSETVKDPALLTNFLAEQAPQLIPSLGAARLIKPIAGIEAAVSGAVGTGAAQQGADIAAGTYEQIYKELIKKGASETEAAGAALGHARATGASAFVISLLAQRLPGARAIEEAMAGKEGQLGRILSGVKGAVGETVSEVAEETPAKFLQNLSLQQVAPEISLTGGLGETAAMAALGGAGLGGVAGLARRPAQPTPTPAPEIEEPAPPMMLEGKGVFTPVALPDGSVAMTREDLARYEEEQFRKKYEPQITPKPEPAPEAPPAMPTEAGLSYATATQEIELLKRQPRTEESSNRIRELQTFKMDLLIDQMRRSQQPVRPELVELRKQMESGMMTEEGMNRAIDQMLAEFERKTQSLQKPPKSDEQRELDALTTEANKISKQIASVKGGKAKGENLKTFLKGKLTPEDVMDISPEKSMKPLAAKSAAGANVLADMVGDGMLDRWLPPNMRHDVATFDEQESTEYIKEMLRNDNFREFDAKMEERQLAETLSNIEQRIEELRAPIKVAQEVEELPAEERRQEAIATAAQAGFEGAPIEAAVTPEEQEEYYPDMNEVAPPPKNEQEAKEEEVDKKQAESANVPDALGELVMLHQFGKPLGGQPKFTAVPGGVSAEIEFSPNKELSNAVANGDALGVIQQLQSSQNPFVKRIGDLASKASPFKIGLYPENASRRAKKYSGIYVPSERSVYAKNKAAAASEHVISHEIVHHLTVDAIRNPTESQKPAVEKINRLYQHVKSVLSKQGKGKLYALKNVEEFVSESNSNVNFQYELAKIPYQRQTAWSAFTKFVSELLGFKNSNALTEIIALTDELVSTPSQQASFAKNEAIGVKAEQVKEAAKKAIRAIEGKREGINQETGFAHVPEDFLEKLRPIFAPEGKTFADKMETYKDRTFQRLAQGIADQYRTIKDYSPLAYMKARLSKTIDGALEGLTFNGEVKLTDGALDIKPNTKGLIETLKPVGNEVNSFLIWLALNRDAALVERGRIASINPEIVAERNKLAAGKIGNQSRLEVYENVRKELNKLNKSVLDVALEKGLIDREAYKTFLNDVYYIPFYKMIEEGEVADVRSSAGLANKYFSKQLKGGEKPFGDLMENLLRNWSHILSSSMKNDAALETLMAATDAGAAFPNLKSRFRWEDGKVYVGDKLLAPAEIDGVKYEAGELRPGIFSSEGKGLVKTMYKGYPAYFDVVDPLLLESVMSIGYLGPKSKFLDVARDFKNILQFGVTISPAFKIRNLFRDSVSAMAVTDLKLNPFANVVKGWTSSDKNNPSHISALAGGAIFNFGSAYEGDQARLIKRLLDSGVNGDSILNTESKIEAGLAKAWRAYQDWGNKSEAANRMALYKQLRDSGMSHLEASFYARDMLDFSMQGAWPAFRLVTQVVPFLNARVQGLYKLGRDGIIPTSRVIYNTVTGKPIDATDAQKAQQFSIVTGAVVLASLMLYLAYKDDDEFKKREQWDRDNFWWFRLPGMDTALRVPKPFEIGAFGTMAERVAEQIIDQGAEGRVFEESLKRMMTDTFAINPMPQMFKPLVDLYANKDSFTGAPIETAGMERLSKEERVADSTSPLAIALSKTANVFLPESAEFSPVQADYAIKAYFGWLGGTISAASHYAVQPFAKGAYPTPNWAETMSMGFVKTLPATQSQFVTAFYQNNKEIGQAYADMRHYAELGQSDKVQEILEEKGDKIAMAKFYDKVSKDMSKIRQVITTIRNDETMPGDQKREEIDRLKNLIGELAKQAEEVRKSLRQ